jgi:hypothetical protein
MEVPMKQFVFAIATLFLMGLTAPAFAATMAQQDAHDTNPNFNFQPKDYWAVIDTQKNCALIDSKPSPYDVSGMKILGKVSGFSSLSAAKQQVKSDHSECKGTVGLSLS